MFVVGGVACQKPVEPCDEAQTHLNECFPDSQGQGDGGPLVGACVESRLCLAECINAASCEDLVAESLWILTPGAQKLLACVDACSP